MQLTLTDHDARMLHGILHDYLPELHRETARTSLASRELRHELSQREELCEKLLRELEHSKLQPLQPIA
jgi:hypothetical protein